jgi:hypothetical protein
MGDGGRPDNKRTALTFPGRSLNGETTWQPFAFRCEQFLSYNAPMAALRLEDRAVTKSTFAPAVNFVNDLAFTVARAARSVEGAASPLRLAARLAAVARDGAAAMADLRRDLEECLSSGLPGPVVVRDFPHLIEWVEQRLAEMEAYTETLRAIPNAGVREVVLPDIVSFAEETRAYRKLLVEAAAAANVPIPADFWGKVSGQEPGPFEPSESVLERLEKGGWF